MEGDYTHNGMTPCIQGVGSLPCSKICCFSNAWNGQFSSRKTNHLRAWSLEGFWNGHRQWSNNQTWRCNRSLLQVRDGHPESTRVVAAQGEKLFALRV